MSSTLTLFVAWAVAGAAVLVYYGVRRARRPESRPPWWGYVWIASVTCWGLGVALTEPLPGWDRWIATSLFGMSLALPFYFTTRSSSSAKSSTVRRLSDRRDPPHARR